MIPHDFREPPHVLDSDPSDQAEEDPDPRLERLDRGAHGTASYNLPNGGSYQVVVASQDGNSTDTYSIGIKTILYQPPILQAQTTLDVLPLTISTLPDTASSPSALDTPAFIPLMISTPNISLVNVLLLNPAPTEPTPA